MIHNRPTRWSPGPFRWLVMALTFLSTTLAQTNPACSICGTGGTVGAPDEPIVDPLTQQNTTCGALDDLGQAGNFNVLQCPVVQLFVENAGACACTGGPTSAPTAASAPTTPAPAPVPTAAPVATTAAPSAAPVAATSAPSAAGTATRAPVAGTSAPTGAPVATPGTAAPSAAAVPSVAPAPGTSAPGTSAPVAAPPSAAPVTRAPTAKPAPAPTPAQTASLSGGAIAGIVIGALLFVAILAAALYYDQCGGRKSRIPVEVPPDYYDPEPGSPPARTSMSTPPAQAAPVATAAAVGVAGGAAAASRATDSPSEQVAKDSPSDVPSDFDSSQPSLAMTGGSQGDGDEAGSYAYSLDAGNVTATGGGGTDTASVMTGASAATFSTTSRKFKRTVVAPAGRLGIVIDTTLEGPVVHTVKPDSPLKGVIFVGDIIVAIDDVDTKAMTATSITSLMVKTAAQERTLTVLSNDPKR